MTTNDDLVYMYKYDNLTPLMCRSKLHDPPFQWFELNRWTTPFLFWPASHCIYWPIPNITSQYEIIFALTQILSALEHTSRPWNWSFLTCLYAWNETTIKNFFGLHPTQTVEHWGYIVFIHDIATLETINWEGGRGLKRVPRMGQIGFGTKFHVLVHLIC